MKDTTYSVYKEPSCNSCGNPTDNGIIDRLYMKKCKENSGMFKLDSYFICEGCYIDLKNLLGIKDEEG